MGSRERQRAYALAFLVLAVWLVQPSAARGTRPLYDYYDDFATNKAETDSYLHSEFVETLPGFHEDGLLMYSGQPPNRVLGFYGGFDPGIYAYLSYRFPLEGGPYTITDCVIEVSLQGDGVSFQIDRSNDGLAWSALADIDAPGSHVIRPLYMAPLEGWQYLRFRSENALLNSLRVTMSCSTPVEPTTWGRVKALFL